MFYEIVKGLRRGEFEQKLIDKVFQFLNILVTSDLLSPGNFSETICFRIFNLENNQTFLPTIFFVLVFYVTPSDKTAWRFFYGTAQSYVFMSEVFPDPRGGYVSPLVAWWGGSGGAD